MAGSPQTRPPLVDLANLITKNNSLMIVGDVITVSVLKTPTRTYTLYSNTNFNFQTKISYKSRMRATKEGQQWLLARKIKSFYNIVEGVDFETGVQALIQTSGIGKLAPNILLMGFKSDWQTSDTDSLKSYFDIMQ